MKLADTNAAAVAAGRKPATIRAWASDGLLTRYGTDGKGRALYDLDEVDRVSHDRSRAAA